MRNYFDCTVILDLRTICNELAPVQHKLSKIGVQLGVPQPKLMEFKNSDDPLAALIDYCLCGNVEGVPLTWRSVVDALMCPHVDERGLAKDIEEKYCGKIRKETADISEG